MNEHLEAGPECFRIIREFETAPKNCPQTPEGAALQAYLCPSGQATLYFGCCFHADGRPVQMGDELFDEAVGEQMLDYCVRDAEAYVRRWVTIPLTQYQFDALVSFRFNTRETTLRKSTRLLPAVNAGSWDAAANAFTEFVYGSARYNGLEYQQALRGLLRRRLCEALIFLGYDWSEAVKDNDVALPCDRKLIKNGTVYRDTIRADGVTTLAQVLVEARQYRLPESTPVPDDDIFEQVGGDGLAQSQASANAQAEVEVVRPAEALPSPPRATTSPADAPLILDNPVSAAPPSVQSPPGEAAEARLESVPAPVAPKPQPAPPPVEVKPSGGGGPASVPKPRDPPIPVGAQQAGVNASQTSGVDWSNCKSLVMSRRFWGLFLVVTGRIHMLWTGSNHLLGAAADPIMQEMFSGFAVMVVGEIIQHWGEKKATRPLK